MARPPKYPWRTMKVGEQFQIAAGSLDSARAMAHTANNRTGRHFRVHHLHTGELVVTRVRA